jgi:hypothetical protein
LATAATTATFDDLKRGLVAHAFTGTRRHIWRHIALFKLLGVSSETV